MTIHSKKWKKLAALGAAGVIFCLQAMTVMAGTRGAAVPDLGGPGVVSQQEQENASEAGQQEQAGLQQASQQGWFL